MMHEVQSNSPEIATSVFRSDKPVLAILTMEDEAQLFRGNRQNFADLVRTGQSMGFIVYVLTVNQLSLQRPAFKGYVYNEATDTWKLRMLPVPNVIYNRIPQREDEALPSVKKTLAAFRNHPYIRLFNPVFFNKWHLFEWLRRSSLTRPYIPATRKLISAEGLGMMMKRHRYLYLKPVSGKAGRGIMTVRFRKGKNLPYRLKIQDNTKSSTYNCASIQRLWTRVRKHAGSELYIAQQGIKLASYEDRRFDLRVLAQKNERGQWDITGIGARLAGSSSITTHVPRGGMIEDPAKLLAHTFGDEMTAALLGKARSVALLITKQIERASGQTLGEMSMDLGVDHKGSIWFFEANSKPMKFDEPHIRQRSLERIFQYSSYLAKQKKRRGARS